MRPSMSRLLLATSVFALSAMVVHSSASATPVNQPPTSGALTPASPRLAAPLQGLLADYDGELRLPNGRVDVDGMVDRLKELGVNSAFWLIWHAATDWEDLKLFLPKAAERGIR